MARELTSYDRKWVRIAKDVLASKGSHCSGMSKCEALDVLYELGAISYQEREALRVNQD